LPLLCTYFLNGHVLLERESQHLNASLSDLQAFMEDKRFELEKTLKDYALWTEHYDAVLEKNGAWLQDNVFGWVPEHFGIDLVVLWDKSRPYWASRVTHHFSILKPGITP